MPNKIKDIFSDDMFNIGGHLRFSDDESYKSFLDALKIVQAEGRVVPVKGVTSITEEVRHQGVKFPLEEYKDISDFVIGPATESVHIPVKLGTEEKIITLLRSRTTDKITLRSEPDSIVSFRFIFLNGENRHTVNYKVQFEKAKSIEDVAESFGTAAALLATLYKYEDKHPVEEGKISIADAKSYFCNGEAFFRRLTAVAKEFDFSFSPSMLNNLSSEEQHDIDELYLLLCKKQVVRLNAKLTSTDSTAVTAHQCNENLDIGSKVQLVFLGTIEFKFLRQTVLLHTANLVLNAVVKEIQDGNDDAIKILYGDSDSKPMYMAFSAFKTEKEAADEADSILEREEIYANAPTINACIKQFYSTANCNSKLQ